MSAQIIKPAKAAPSSKGRPTNLFDYLHTNPYKIADDKPAFIRASDGKALLRGQLRTDAKRLAHVYTNKLGLKAGQRIAIFSPNSTIYPIAVHAGLCSGVVLVPMNPGYSAEEIIHPLKDSSVEFILTHPSVLPIAHKGLELAGISKKTKDGKDRILILTDDDEIKRGPNGELDVRSLLGKEEAQTFKIQDPAEVDAFISYSSGTSGLPKGVQLTHLNLIAVTHAIDAGLGDDFSTDSVHLGVLPFQHIFANTKFLSHAVFAGIPVVVLPKFDLAAWCEAVQKYKVTIGIVVPPILVLIAKSPVVQKYDLSSLKFFMCGAAPLSADLGDQVERRFPTLRVTQGYGLTETSPTATYTKYREYREHKGSCGALIPGVEARLVDDDGKDVGHQQGKDGVPGELWLRGPTVINRKKGYLNLPKVNEECITEDQWFKTGDVAVYRDGYFWITDRKKELIKYKGNQVAPASLEALLLKNDRVADCAVLGIYSESEATEFPIAYVVPAESAGVKDNKSKAAFEKEIQEWVNKQVANHMKLRGGVRVIEVVPKSPSGKILRRVLRDQQAKEAQAPKAKL